MMDTMERHATTATPEAEPELRVVELRLDELRRMTLVELADLCELGDLDLDELRPEALRSMPPARMIRLVVALAVVMERRTHPGATIEDARAWDIRVVKDADPNAGAPTRDRGSGGS